MVKKLTLLILSVVATTGAGAAMRWTDPTTGIEWTYTVSDGKASVGGGNPRYDTAVPKSITGALVVPAIINGYPVTSIEVAAFSGCDGLTSVTMPSNVLSIAYEAFYGCSGLTHITIPDGVTSIRGRAFYGCSGLTSVTIPDGVTSIGDSAFTGCSGLTSIIIPDNVTSISSYAFSWCSGLTNVTIPYSVMSIGFSAFQGCSGLRSFAVDSGNANYKSENGLLLSRDGKTVLAGINGEVSIPEGVTSINPSAFYGCSGLTCVTIPNSVTNIGSYAFDGCCGLTRVTIPNSVTSIGSSAFSGCSGLEEITLPFVGSRRGNTGDSDSLFGYIFGTWSYDGGMQTLQYYSSSNYSTFYIPSKLKKVVVTDETMLGYGAFYGCSSLNNVTMPDGVTCIGGKAFYGCSGLTNVTIPNNVDSIGSSAFSGCSGLTMLEVTDLTKWCGISFADYHANPLCYAQNLYLGGKKVEDLVIPDSVTTIGPYSFYNCTGITSVTIPSNVTSIASSAFYGCNGLTNVQITDIAKWCSISFAGKYANPLYYAHSLYLNGEKVVDLVLPDSVTSIGSSAFYGFSGLTCVTIPNSVTNIGSYAFDGCCGLTRVTIPNSVTSIGSSAFSGCSGLEEIALPFVGSRRGNTGNSDSLFGYIFGTWSYDGGMQTLQYYSSSNYSTFYIPSKLKKVVVTDEEILGQGAFYGCIGLNNVTMPDSVTRIEGKAFYGCSGLTRVTIPENVTSIGDYAFYRCRSLMNASMPSSVTIIDDYAFFDCRMLTSVTIPDGVTTIGASAFSGCSGLVSVRIPDSVTSIGSSAFSACSGLISFSVDGGNANYKSVNGLLLSGDGKTLVAGINGDVIVPGSVTRIVDRAFVGCSGLMSIIIPDSVVSIGYSAFSGCSELKEITLPFIGAMRGNTESPDSTFGYIFGSSSYVGGIDTYQYYSYLSCSSFYIPSKLVKVIVTDETVIGYGAFSNCSGLMNVTISDSAKIIDYGAFSGCSGLTCVTIPNSVTNIGSSAFSGCSGLKSMTIPDKVTSIGSSAFYGCSGLKSVTIPDGVTRIGHQAFYGCSGLSSIIIPSGVASIGGQAFSGCRGLTSVEMPDSVTSIDNGVFQNCSNLTRLTLPDNVMSIEDGAFDGCTNLVDMRIPNGVTNIGSSAFSGCSRLTSVTIPCGVTIINSNTFYGCSGLTSVTISDGVKSIGERAFEECIMLKSITIPESVTNIENYAFLDCSKLNGVTILGSVTNIGNYVFWGCDELTNVYLSKDYSGSTSVFPSNANIIRYAPRQMVMLDANGGAVAVRNVEVAYGRPYGFIRVPFRDGYSFDGWTLDGEMILEDTIVTALDDHVIVAQWTAKEYDVKFNSAGGVVGMASKTVKFDSRYGELPTASCDGYVFLGWMLNGEDVCAETVVKTTGDHTLTAKWGVKVGSGIWMTTICDEPITLGAPHVPPTGEVLIPASIAGRTVVGITAEAFAGNNEVTAVTVRLAVNGVADGVLPYVPLTLIVDDNTQVIPDVVRENVRKAVFADGVTMIGDNYFAGCPNLEEFDIADTVIRIGKNVFEAASSLKTVVQNGLKVYQGWCLGFSDGVDHVGRVMLPDGVRGIAPLAFKGNFDIVSVGFSSGVRFVGAGAFRDCTGIEDVALPEGVVVVDREAFRNCTYVQSLTLPTTLVQIGAGAFANATSLAGVTVPEGVADIGAVAFSNCWRMMSAEIPASVTNIGVAAFADCRRLAGVTVPLGLGTMSELFPSSYDKITSVRVVTAVDVASVAPVMDAGMFAGCEAMVALTLPESLTKIADDAFVGCTSMATFELPDSVKCIGARAFKGLSQLTAFEFPDGLVSVGDEAFSACAGISALMLPKGIESIGERAFSGLSLLSRTDIPASVTSIGAAAFGDCTRVRAISLPGDIATVATIWPGAYRLITSAVVTARAETAPYQILDSLFEGCEALVVVELPLGVTKIGARAFAACTSLTDAGIPFGVTSLGKEVFSGCVNLSNVSLPTGLRVLSSRMFEGCESLNEVIVPESVGTIGESVFYGCSSLRAVAYVGNAPEYNAAAYAGVPAAMVTKVVNGSMGWDGIATSKSLPEFWPVGSQNEITFWAPNRFMVDFVVDGERSVTTQNVEQVTGTTYMLPADIVRRGAAFGGWWTAIDGGARVLASTQVVLTRPHTFYARWTFNRYTVQFDANGGEGEMKSQGMAVDTACNLTECTFIRMGYAFMGWATEPDGEVMFSDATEVINLSYVQNAVVTLYAVWEECELTLADVLCDDARGVGFSVDFETDWAIDFTDGHDAPSARSGEIAAAENGGRTSTTLKATVTGEGTGSFWWKVSCEDMDDEYGEWYDYAMFKVDGIAVAQIAGERDWEQVEFVVSGAGTHTLSWTFTRDDYDEDGVAYEDAVWVDGVIWTPRPVTVTFAAGGAEEGEAPEAIVKYQGYELALPGAGTLVNGTCRFVGWTDGVATCEAGSTYIVPATNVTLTAVWELKAWTLGEAVDAAALSFVTGGNADWSVSASNGSTNGVAAKSGTVENGEASWIETTIHGGGTLAFHWNVMGGIYRNTPFAYAKVEVDGVQQAQEFNTEGWKEQTVEIDGAGAHTVRWTYLRTSARMVDVGDCAWIDEVVWMPSGGTIPELTPAQAAAWVSNDLAARYAKSGESAADYQSRFEAKFGADPVAAMAMPTDKKDVHGNDMYVWQDYVAGTDPTDTNSVLTATITMVDGAPVVEWSPKLGAAEEARRRYTIYGRAGLEPGEEWHSPTNALDRFFKVGVELR